jgi:hypothetical protein
MKLIGKDKTVLIKEWQTKAGLPARIAFTRCSFLCGYVAIDKSHPFHGVKSAWDEGDYLEDEIGKLRVHGGLTWIDNNTPPDFENEGLWWFGFDCNHSDDLVWDGEDDMNKFRRSLGFVGTFKDENYVMEECEKLAEQIVNWKPTL